MFLLCRKFFKNFKIPLDKCILLLYNGCKIQKGGIKIDGNRSRAEYFRERRKTRKNFNVLLPEDKYNIIDKTLKEKNKTKTEWLIEKIDEETKK